MLAPGQYSDGVTIRRCFGDMISGKCCQPHQFTLSKITGCLKDFSKLTRRKFEGRISLIAGREAVDQVDGGRTVDWDPPDLTASPAGNDIVPRIFAGKLA